jgi:TolA-binding protein
MTSLSVRNDGGESDLLVAECPRGLREANLPFRWGFSVHANPEQGLEKETRNKMSSLKQILSALSQEIERLSRRNEMLERRLASITGALQGAVRLPPGGSGRTSRAGRRSGRRGAPPKFNEAQARQLRRDYEKGATSAQLARKYKAALPTILSTLRRAGATLRRGRPSKSR